MGPVPVRRDDRGQFRDAPVQLEDPQRVPLIRKPWTDLDTAKLQEVWPAEIKSSAQLRKVAATEKKRITAAIGRSWTVVKKKLQLLPTYQVVRLDRPWTDEERAALTKHYHRKSIRQIAKLLNRTYTSVAQQAHRLDTNIRANRHWTEEEDKLLRELWADAGQRKLRASFPTRSMVSIMRRAKKDLGLGRRLQGLVSLSMCARHVGVNTVMMKRILEWGKVGHMLSGKRRYGVDLLDATDAATEWFKLETAPQAALRLHVTGSVLYIAAKRAEPAGKKPKSWHRRPKEEWDRLLAEHRANFKRNRVKPIHAA